MSDDVSTQGEDTEGDALLAELRDLAARHDPVPPEAVAAARSALAWRTMDAELAELTADSSVEAGGPALVRGPATSALLTFQSAGLAVEIEVAASAERRRILGQLVPPQAGSIEVDHGDGRISIVADEVGRFSVDDLAAGPVRLRCRVGAGDAARVVVTDWFLA